jgi:hypothetical protein
MLINKLLNRRLHRSEQALAWRRKTIPVPSPAPEIARWLASVSIDREGNEGLAETTARAMGITMPQLKAELHRIAAGG